MKKLKTSYNNDGNKIVKKATQDKIANKNLNFLVDLAMVASNTKPTEDKPQMFNEAWHHPNKES